MECLKFINNPHYIYILIDPQNSKIKYVGQTTNLKKREEQHRKYNKHIKDKRNSWVASLNKKNLYPILQSLFCCNKEYIDDFEKFFIKFYGRETLLNLTDGGPGPEGMVISKQECKRRSKRMKLNHPMLGKHHTEESKLKMSLVRKGKKLSEETRKRMSKSRAGVPVPALQVPRPCRWIKIIDNNGIVYNSISEAAEKLNLYCTNISKVLKGKRKRTGRYSFKRAY